MVEPDGTFQLYDSALDALFTLYITFWVPAQTALRPIMEVRFPGMAKIANGDEGLPEVTGFEPKIRIR